MPTIQQLYASDVRPSTTTVGTPPPSRTRTATHPSRRAPMHAHDKWEGIPHARDTLHGYTSTGSGAHVVVYLPMVFPTASPGESGVRLKTEREVKNWARAMSTDSVATGTNGCAAPPPSPPPPAIPFTASRTTRRLLESNTLLDWRLNRETGRSANNDVDPCETGVYCRVELTHVMASSGGSEGGSGRDHPIRWDAPLVAFPQTNPDAHGTCAWQTRNGAGKSTDGSGRTPHPARHTPASCPCHGTNHDGYTDGGGKEEGDAMGGGADVDDGAGAAAGGRANSVARTSGLHTGSETDEEAAAAAGGVGVVPHAHVGARDLVDGCAPSTARHPVALVTLDAFLEAQQLPRETELLLLHALYAHVDAWVARLFPHDTNGVSADPLAPSHPASHASVAPDGARSCTGPPLLSPSPSPSSSSRRWSPPPFWIAAYAHTPAVHHCVVNYATACVLARCPWSVAGSGEQPQGTCGPRVCHPLGSGGGGGHVKSSSGSTRGARGLPAVVIPWPAWVPPMSVSLNILGAVHVAALGVLDSIAAASAADTRGDGGGACGHSWSSARDEEAARSSQDSRFIDFTTAVFGREAVTAVLRRLFAALGFHQASKQVVKDIAYGYHQCRHLHSFERPPPPSPPSFSPRCESAAPASARAREDGLGGREEPREEMRIVRHCVYPSCAATHDPPGEHDSGRGHRSGGDGSGGEAAPCAVDLSPDGCHAPTPATFAFPSLLELVHAVALTWAGREPFFSTVGTPLHTFLAQHGPAAGLHAVTTTAAAAAGAHPRALRTALSAFTTHLPLWRLWWTAGDPSGVDRARCAPSPAQRVRRLSMAGVGATPGKRNGNSSSSSSGGGCAPHGGGSEAGPPPLTPPSVVMANAAVWGEASAGPLAPHMRITVTYTAAQCLRWYLLDFMNEAETGGGGGEARVDSAEAYTESRAADAELVAYGLHVLPALLHVFLLSQEITCALQRALQELQQGSALTAGPPHRARRAALRYFIVLLCWAAGAPAASRVVGQGGDGTVPASSAPTREAMWRRWLLPFLALHWHAPWWTADAGAPRHARGDSEEGGEREHDSIGRAQDEQPEPGQLMLLREAHRTVVAVAAYYVGYTEQLLRTLRGLANSSGRGHGRGARVCEENARPRTDTPNPWRRLAPSTPIGASAARVTAGDAPPYAAAALSNHVSNVRLCAGAYEPSAVSDISSLTHGGASTGIAGVHAMADAAHVKGGHHRDVSGEGITAVAAAGGSGTALAAHLRGREDDFPSLTGRLGRIRKTQVRALRAVLDELARHFLCAHAGGAVEKHRAMENHGGGGGGSALNRAAGHPHRLARNEVEQWEELVCCTSARARSTPLVPYTTRDSFLYLRGVLPPWMYPDYTAVSPTDTDGDDSDQDSSSSLSSLSSPSLRLLVGDAHAPERHRKRRLANDTATDVAVTTPPASRHRAETASEGCGRTGALSGAGPDPVKLDPPCHGGEAEEEEEPVDDLFVERNLFPSDPSGSTSSHSALSTRSRTPR